MTPETIKTAVSALSAGASVISAPFRGVAGSGFREATDRLQEGFGRELGRRYPILQRGYERTGKGPGGGPAG